jgi:hypothetical protein
MINILPDTGRASVRHEYVVRLVAVSFFAIAAVALVAAGLLSPSYFALSVVSQQAHAEAERIAGEKNMENENILAELVRAGKEIEALQSLVRAGYGSLYVNSALKQAPAGISVARVLYNDARKEVVISGTASTRDVLLSYSRNAENIPEVVSVALPVGDLAKNEKVPFTLTLSFKPIQ